MKKKAFWVSVLLIAASVIYLITYRAMGLREYKYHSVMQYEGLRGIADIFLYTCIGSILGLIFLGKAAFPRIFRLLSFIFVLIALLPAVVFSLLLLRITPAWVSFLYPYIAYIDYFPYVYILTGFAASLFFVVHDR